MHIQIGRTILLVLGLVVFFSCGPVQKVTYSWKNPAFASTQSFRKIFVAAMVKNPHVRTHLEDEMKMTASARGFGAEKSMDYFPPNFTDQQPIARETMMEKIKALGCDLIFTIVLVDKESEARYVPGDMGLYGPFAGYGLRFRGYYSYWYPFMYDPGYYVTDKTYVMEGNLFDVASESLIWSIQTQSLNPPSVEKFSKNLIDMMLKKGIEDLSMTK